MPETLAAPPAPAAPAAPATSPLGVSTGPANTLPTPITSPGSGQPTRTKPDSTTATMKDRMQARLEKQGVPKPAAAAEKPKAEVPKEADKAEPESNEDAPEAGNESAAPEVDDEDSLMGGDGKPATKPATPEKKKNDPWTKAKEWQSEANKYKAELEAFKKSAPDVEARTKEYEATKKRAEELENHMRYVDFKQSNEYKEKYEKPYNDQWTTAMKELVGVRFQQEDGRGAHIEPKNMLELVNMGTAEARVAAKQAFGDFADDVMIQRNEIKKKFEAMSSAEKQAKEEGVAKFSTQAREQKELSERITKEVDSFYKKSTQGFLTNEKWKEFLQDIDGDDEANTSLRQGRELVDAAYARNPNDPTLTPEQRQKLVKQHAAVTMRAAAFGRVRHLLAKERASHKATQDKLAQYESTVPNRGSQTPATNGTPATSRFGSAEAIAARLKARMS